jgi:chromate transporter
LKTKIAIVIFFISFFLSFIFFNGPWIFPVLLFIGALISRIFTKIEPNDFRITGIPINWFYLKLFFSIFLFIAFTSELSRKYNWSGRKEFNLIENFYRFGSIVFGGGDVLVPMMYEQFVVRPQSEHIKTRNKDVLKIEKNDFLTGSGLVRAIPGPVFSIASYMGIMAFKGEPLGSQLLAGFSALFALYLPGILLVLFLYPVFNNLQQYKSVMQSIAGIQAAVVGLLLTSTLYLLKESILIPVTTAHLGYISFGIIVSTLLLLKFTKINPHYIVVFFLLMGLVF